jgi:cytochrome c5
VKAPPIALAAGLLAVACNDHEAPPSASLHTLRLPDEAVTMPDAPGRDAFLSGCRTCHSPRYVLDQPPLPRKTWQAEVDKMRATYGAPLVATDVPVIVDYLVSVRGSGS